MTEKEFLEKFDKGEEFTEDEIVELIWEFNEVERIEGENRRWSRWVDVVIEVKGRYFMTGYDEGLTEYQDNEYYESYVKEVTPVERTVVVKDWVEVNKNV